MADGKQFKDLFDLTGRHALITGAGSGLGRVFAQAMAAYGARVTCGDVDEVGAEETAAQIREDGGRSAAVLLDVTNETQVRSVAADLSADPVDVLVNNAGIAFGRGRAHELDSDAWRRVMAVNLDGVFYCSKAFLPHMLSRGRGSIVNVSSVFGLKGVSPDILARCHYAASKAAVVGLTKQLAVEYGADGIRVNAIAPGWHSGTRLGRQDPESGERDFTSLLIERTPMKRMGEPAELAGLAVYLASDASSFVTGEIIAHDGGWMAW